MFKRLIAVFLFIQLVLLIGCEGRTESRQNIDRSSQRSRDRRTTANANVEKETISAENPLPFEIVEQKRVKKGGSFDPLSSPQYVLFDVKAVLNGDSPDLSESNVRVTLRALLNAVRSGARQRGEQIDGVSAFLYQSRDHITGGTSAIGRAEWWPKGHSFNLDNEANIKNKSTYVEEFKVLSLPKPTETDVQRLSENQRRVIFTELVRAERRASREAEAQYPTDPSNIPSRNLKTYDFKTAMQKKMELEEELRAKYMGELLKRYEITRQELDTIKIEALNEQWPLPSQ